MTTIDTMDCGEISCEYCTKDRCIYMKDREIDSEAESEDQ